MHFREVVDVKLPVTVDTEPCRRYPEIFELMAIELVVCFRKRPYDDCAILIDKRTKGGSNIEIEGYMEEEEKSGDAGDSAPSVLFVRRRPTKSEAGTSVASEVIKMFTCAKVAWAFEYLMSSLKAVSSDSVRVSKGSSWPRKASLIVLPNHPNMYH